MPALDKTTAEEISSFLLSCPARGKFDALKTFLISTFGLTQADKDASLLAISDLNDRKRSGLLWYMNSLTTADDQMFTVFCSLFLWQLPESVRVMLIRDPPTSIMVLQKSPITSMQPSPWPLTLLQFRQVIRTDAHICLEVQQTHAVFTMPS